MRREVIVAAALLAIAPPAAAADGLPRVLRFSVVPELIEVGQSATILYAVENADRVTISGFGSVDFAGSITVGPSESVRYSLTATNAAGSFTVVAGVLVVRTTSPPPRSFTLSTNRLDCFDVAVGGSRTFAVTIDPLETVDIQLTLQQPANGPFRLLGTEPSFTAASAKRVELAFRPTAAGSLDATLEVRNARRSEVDVVSLHANGVTPPGPLLSAVVSVAGPSTGLNGSHWVSIYGERLSEINSRVVGRGFSQWSFAHFSGGCQGPAGWDSRIRLFCQPQPSKRLTAGSSPRPRVVDFDHQTWQPRRLSGPTRSVGPRLPDSVRWRSPFSAGDASGRRVGRPPGDRGGGRARSRDSAGTDHSYLHDRPRPHRADSPRRLPSRRTFAGRRQRLTAGKPYPDAGLRARQSRPLCADCEDPGCRRRYHPDKT